MDQLVGTGCPLDSSGNGNHALLRAGYTDNASGPWRNPGYLTTTNSSDQWAMIPGGVASFDLSSRHFICSFVINMAAPASQIFSLITMGSSAQPGIYFGMLTTGKMRVSYRDASAAADIVDTVAVVADSTDHTVGIVIDRETRDLYLFVDGVFDKLKDAAIPAASVITMPTSYRAGIGGGLTNSDSASNGTAVSMKIKGFHLMHPERLPLNLHEVMQRLHRNPLQPILETQVVERLTAPRQLIVFGQSNELGAGLIPDRTMAYGPPYYDTITYPNVNSGQRSMWPRLMERMARERGIWVKPWIAARGGTSISECFVGNLRTWASGIKLCFGSYVVSDGGIWRDNNNAGGVHVGTSAPTGTSNVTTADGIPWVYIKAYAGETMGIQSAGSALFDPNGYVATGYNALSQRFGFGERWVLIEYGQNDGAIPTSRADYANAHIVLADYFLAQGCRVAIGLSIYSTETANGNVIEDGYQNNLIPAISDVLAHYSGNANVIAAENLRNTRGVLTKSGRLGVLELKTDGYHGTDELYKYMSDDQFSALVASGRW